MPKIAIVIGFDIDLSDDLTPEQKEWLERLRKSSKYLLSKIGPGQTADIDVRDFPVLVNTVEHLATVFIAAEERKKHPELWGGQL